MSNSITPIIISKTELSKVEDNLLNENQLQFILRKTPKIHIKKRPAKGGGEWSYVDVSYVQKSLNLMFGWDWDFKVLDEKILVDAGEVVVKGELTIRTNGKVIVKTQFGNKDIMFKRDANRQPTKIPLSVGNDLKAAASDALKKCSSMIGLANDVYNPESFKEVFIEEANRDIALELANAKSNGELNAIWNSITEREQIMYKRLFEAIKF